MHEILLNMWIHGKEFRDSRSQYTKLAKNKENYTYENGLDGCIEFV